MTGDYGGVSTVFRLSYSKETGCWKFTTGGIFSAVVRFYESKSATKPPFASWTFIVSVKRLSFLNIARLELFGIQKVKESHSG